MARKIIDYTVVSAINSAVIVEAAVEHIAEGWEPFGGICLAYERNIHREPGANDFNLPNDFQHYVQAFVRYENDG